MRREVAILFGDVVGYSRLMDLDEDRTYQRLRDCLVDHWRPLIKEFGGRIVGTGGDGVGTLNISTAAALVVAGYGLPVAKHGNRSVSSSTGSADVLEAAGVNLSLTAEQVARAVEEIGVGFMFAPAHHSAMKHAIGPRKEMAVRTIFNVLGPLTNPAGAPNQVLGVFSQELTQPLAEVLNALGSRHVMVVASDDGLDEISI